MAYDIEEIQGGLFLHQFLCIGYNGMWNCQGYIRCIIIASYMTYMCMHACGCMCMHVAARNIHVHECSYYDIISRLTLSECTFTT